MSIEFEFEHGFQGWSAGFSDYNPTNIGIYEFDSGLRATPDAIKGKTALFIKSMNRSDDVFMYFARNIEGLLASNAYEVELELRFITKYKSKLGAGGRSSTRCFCKGMSVENYAIAC